MILISLILIIFVVNSFALTCNNPVNVCGTTYQMCGPTLTNDELFGTNQGLLSPNGRYAAVLSDKSNFKIYDLNANCDLLWEEPDGWFPADNGINSIVLQKTDGNVVLYGGPGRTNPRWASHHYAHNKPIVELTMQDDGNLVAYYYERIAYWDRMGYAAQAGLFNFDGENGVYSDGKALHIGMYGIWVIVGIFVAFLVANCICLTAIFWKAFQKSNENTHKLVSMDSDMEDV